MVAVSALVFVAYVGAEYLFASVSFIWHEHEVRIVDVGIVLGGMNGVSRIKQCARNYHLVENSPLPMELVSS